MSNGVAPEVGAGGLRVCNAVTVVSFIFVYIAGFTTGFRRSALLDETSVTGAIFKED